jgi:tripartite-type tricarboxylate transporter receptor subunit TctC
LALSAALFGAVVTTASAQAPAYPTQNIKMVIGFAAGGPTDVIGRILAQHMSASLGQTVIVENRTGANSLIATKEVAKAKPDGYTVLFASLSHNVNRLLLNEKADYDPLKDFTPISLAANLPLVLVTAYDSPFKTLQELVAKAKSSPDSVSYGSAGNGNTSHLAAEMFQTATGTKMEHIPYKGSGPVVVALLGGEIDLTFDSFSTSYPHVPTGKFKPLAVAGAKRAPLLPNVPTISETVPGFVIDGWYGILAPAGTPKPIVDKLSKAFNEAANTPSVKAQLNASGYDIVGSTPEAFAKTIEDDLLVWGKVVKDSGAKVQ